MKMTKHAEIRKQQRGFSEQSLEIVLRYGRSITAPGGATKVFFGNKECQQVISEFKKVIQIMDRARGTNIIIADDNIITVYK